MIRIYWNNSMLSTPTLFHMKYEYLKHLILRTKFKLAPPTCYNPTSKSISDIFFFK